MLRSQVRLLSWAFLVNSEQEEKVSAFNLFRHLGDRILGLV